MSLLFQTMNLGALVGTVAYCLLGKIGLYADPTVEVYVAAGMAAALTSIVGVTFASLALVVEVLGSEYSSAAAAVVCAVCFTASRRFGLYARASDKERE